MVTESHPIVANLYRTNELLLNELLGHKGRRWDLLAGSSLAGSIQEWAPEGRCACRASIGTRANTLQHTAGRSMVESQLPGAVPAHPDPHGPEKHSHARHGLLGWTHHTHIVVGLGLREERRQLC